VLNQLNYLAQEENPINAEKKRTITKVLLKNLGAVFGGSTSVVVGPGLAYTPIDIPAGTFNAYTSRSKRPSWFGGAHDLSHIPAGTNKFGGVTYKPLDFRTSPVPSVVMLAGEGSETDVNEVKGIGVRRRADALFFLHAFNASEKARRSNATGRPVVFCYVVHYADGSRADAPVAWNEGVSHWISKDPQPLAQAMIGWAAPFPNDTSGQKAVVYSMQWTNPKPDVRIESVDVLLGPDGRAWGAPALLAITAADVVK
jgi:beta-galactosidase